MKKGLLQSSWERCAGIGRSLAESSHSDFDDATPLSLLRAHGKLILAAPFAVTANVIAEVAGVDKTKGPSR